MSYSSEVLADSPLLFLKLDEASGTTAADSSGAGRDGTHSSGVVVNQPSLLADGSGASAKYAATTTSLTTVPYGSWMNSSGLTVEARIKPDAAAISGTRVIAGRQSSSASSNRQWQFTLLNGKIRGVITPAVGTETSVDGATTLAADTSYTVAMTYDGSTIRVYVNGALDGSVALAGGLNTPSVALTVGVIGVVNSTAAFHFPGVIDGFAVFGTALSETRLNAHHAAALATTGTTSGESTTSGTSSATAGGTQAIGATLTPAGASQASASASQAISASGMASGTSKASATAISGVDLVTGAGAAAATSTGTADAVRGVSGDASSTGLSGALADATNEQPPATTDTTNLANGRTRLGSAEDHTLYPVKPLPTHLQTEPRRIMAQQLPRPVLVNGVPQ